jgi:hypothetical protein
MEAFEEAEALGRLDQLADALGISIGENRR